MRGSGFEEPEFCCIHSLQGEKKGGRGSQDNNWSTSKFLLFEYSFLYINFLLLSQGFSDGLCIKYSHSPLHKFLVCIIHMH